MDEADDDKRVSLNPLNPVAALKALLKVDPDTDPAEDESPTRSADDSPSRQTKKD